MPLRAADLVRRDGAKLLVGKRLGADLDQLTGSDRLRVIINALTRLRFCTGEGGMEQIMALLKPIAGEGKVPVKMALMKDGKAFIKSELKEMTEEKVDDSVFEIPKDYEVVKQDEKE